MNTTFAPSHQFVFAPVKHFIQDDEKKRIMEKVYNSDVFKEFVQEWGVTMMDDIV